MVDRPNIASVFSFINSASKQDEDRLKYRALVAPKHIAKVVHTIEKISMLRETLDEGQKEICSWVLDILDKSLISTTSIKGHTLSMITTNKSVVQINDPRIKKSTFGNLMNPNRDQQDGVAN